MRKNWGWLVLIIAIIVGLFLYSKRPASSPPSVPDQSGQSAPDISTNNSPTSDLSTVTPSANAASNSTVATSYANPPDPAPILPLASSTLDDANIPALPPQTLMENMRAAFHQYASRFGGNPTGTNPEITSALTGQNGKQVNFLSTDSGLRVNGRGELVDTWGSPFFFHQLSGTDMEIHSAGPDRKMWTGDDLVIQ